MAVMLTMRAGAKASQRENEGLEAVMGKNEVTRRKHDGRATPRVDHRRPGEFTEILKPRNIPGLFTGHDHHITRWSGQGCFKMSWVGSGRSITL